MRLASGGSHGHSNVMDAYFSTLPTAATRPSPGCSAATYLLGHFLRQPAPVSFFWKETGAYHIAAAPLARALAAFPLVTIGVTNTECSLTTAMPMMVPQPMNRLHLTDSQACPGHHLAAFT